MTNDKITTAPSPAPTEKSVIKTATEKTLQGQRNINLIWEITQALIAITVTGGVVFVGIFNSINAVNIVFPPTLSNAFFLIIGFYYSRTNHSAIGGIGSKANLDQEYKGR